MVWTTRKRILPVTQVVLHWNGGGGGAVATRQTLVRRNLSVHSWGGADGSEVEWEPDDVVCLHAGANNGWSVGRECQSRGFHAQGYEATIHGRTVRLARWPEAMLESSSAWAYRKVVEHRLFLTVPWRWSLSVTRVLVRDRLPRCGRDIRRPCTFPDAGQSPNPCRVHFRGLVGHYHVCGLKNGRPTKMDPGTDPLLYAAATWGLDLV